MCERHRDKWKRISRRLQLHPNSWAPHSGSRKQALRHWQADASHGQPDRRCLHAHLGVMAGDAPIWEIQLPACGTRPLSYTCLALTASVRDAGHCVRGSGQFVPGSGQVCIRLRACTAGSSPVRDGFKVCVRCPQDNGTTHPGGALFAVQCKNLDTGH